VPPTSAQPSAEVVVSFLNTLDVEEGSDALSDLDAYQEWIAARTRTVTRITLEDLQVARTLRSALRAAVAGDPPVALPDVTFGLSLSRAGDVQLDATDPAGTVAAAVATLAIRDEWRRIKVCPADDCRWAFYDSSRNRSRHWCSMAVCGNRAKARTHRERAR